MNRLTKRADFIENYLAAIFSEDPHTKRVKSLANGTLGVMTSASLAVSIIGQSLAQARGLLSKHKVKAWLKRHPRFHLHFTPTSASWINLVERFFGLKNRQ